MWKLNLLSIFQIERHGGLTQAVKSSKFSLTIQGGPGYAENWGTESLGELVIRFTAKAVPSSSATCSTAASGVRGECTLGVDSVLRRSNPSRMQEVSAVLCYLERALPQKG